VPGAALRSQSIWTCTVCGCHRCNVTPS